MSSLFEEEEVKKVVSHPFDAVFG